MPYDKGDAVECARTGIWQLFHGTARQGDKVERERERAVPRHLLGHHTCWLPCVLCSPQSHSSITCLDVGGDNVHCTSPGASDSV